MGKRQLSKYRCPQNQLYKIFLYKAIVGNSGICLKFFYKTAIEDNDICLIVTYAAHMN